MKKLALAVALAGSVVAAGAVAQSPSGSPERAAPSRTATTDSVTIMRVDVARVALGQRASKLIGATVVNSNDERIGTIDDLVVNPQDKVTYAVISVGGFLGIGSKLVAVPFYSLKTVKEERLMLPGATKEALKGLPEFKYAKS